MQKESTIDLEPNDRLRWLRRLDWARQWQFLDDRRRCRGCGKHFTGRSMKVSGGTRPHGPLRLACPTRACQSGPIDWLYPHESFSRRSQLQPAAAVVRIKRKRRAREINVKTSPVHRHEEIARVWLARLKGWNPFTAPIWSSCVAL